MLDNACQQMGWFIGSAVIEHENDGQDKLVIQRMVFNG
jgi:hypothetical protein